MAYGIKIYGESGNTQIDSEADNLVLSRKQTVNLKSDMYRDGYRDTLWAAAGHIHKINYNRENEMYAIRSDKFVYTSISKEGLFVRQTMYAEAGTADVYIFEKAKNVTLSQYGLMMIDSNGVTQSLGDIGFMKVLDVLVYPANTRNVKITLPTDKKVAVMVGGGTQNTEEGFIYPSYGYLTHALCFRIVGNTLELSSQKAMWDSDMDYYEYWRLGSVYMPVTVALIDVTGL